METAAAGWAVLFAFLVVLLKQMLGSRTQPKNPLPPGPPGLPVIGHLYLLRRPFHHWLKALAHRYGPVLFLRLGSRSILVVSSPSAAEECFTKNDFVFANRPRLINSEYIHYNSTTLAAAPYGSHWRNLRRLTSVHIFAASRVSSFAGTREEEVRAVLRKLVVDAAGGDFRKVDLRSRIWDVSFNTMVRMVCGKSYLRGSKQDPTGEEDRVRNVVLEVMHYTNVSSLADFLPVPTWVDVGGLKRRMMGLRRRMDSLFQDMIEAGRRAAAEVEGEATEKKTFLDVLLGLREAEGDYYTDNVIRGILQVLLTAGIEASFLAVEWTMAFLLNHPEIMKKARAQVDAVVGHDRLLSSSDIPNLAYLHNIVKETLRVQPPGPLLLPHQSSGDCTVGGYHVPAGTMLLVNAYAIHRDPKLWTSPGEFRPERFEEGEGKGYNMIAFGAGRRSCPGDGLATSLMLLVVGTLVQCFEWDRVSDAMVDMSEADGLTTPMANPLEALYRPRAVMSKVLSQL